MDQTMTIADASNATIVTPFAAVDSAVVESLRRELTQTRHELSTTQTRLKASQEESQELQLILDQVAPLMQQRHQEVTATFIDPGILAHIRSLQTTIDKHEETIRELSNKLRADSYDRSSLEGRKLMAKCKELSEENNQLFIQLTATERPKLDALQTQVDSLNVLVDQLQTGLETQKNLNDNLQKKVDSLNLELQTQQQLNAQLQATEVGTQMKLNDELEKTVNSLTEELNAEETKVTELEEKNAALNERIKQLEREKLQQQQPHQ